MGFACLRQRKVMLFFFILFVYGLCAFIYTELGLVMPGKKRVTMFIGNVINRKDSEIEVSTDQEKSIFQCPILSIISKNITQFHEIECKEHQPSKSGCQFASKTYAYDFVKRNCMKEPSINICEIKNRKFVCSNENCPDNKTVTIHMFVNDLGKVNAVAWSKNVKELEELLHEYATKSRQNGYKFLFLSCGKKNIQLVLLNDIAFSDYSEVVSKKKNNRVNRKVNINIVMLDSISRAHFYRSLPKTIDVFKDLNLNDKTEVLDFQLFQALHGHSAENAHGLFSGTVFPLNLTDSERESLPVGIPGFFQYFKDKGYNTLYQDDMCYDAIWGFRADIGGADDWKELRKKVQSSFVDDTGLMFSNCKIFEKFDTDHVFNLDEDNFVCFNGHQHDKYFLDYIANYYTYRDSSETSGVSYSALNAAHDYGGVRIQALDKDLSNFVQSISDLDNTLTVILADHGNTYTDFVYIDLEGKYEMFHPSLFFVIPKGVKKLIGENMMSILRANQKRLLTMIDLHHSFKYVADSAYPTKGVFELLPPSRKCSDLPLRFPNYCVCEGWNTPRKNSTDLVGQLEFAVGKLNNLITKSSVHGKCKRLVPTLFKNILERKDGDFYVTSFELETAGGSGISIRGEKVNIEVKAKLSGGLSDHAMQLVSWDRMSKFGIYRQCSDVVDTKFALCVCDKENSKHDIKTIRDFYQYRTSAIYSIFNGIVKEKINVLNNEGNLAVVLRTYIERRYDDNDKEVEPYLISVTFEVVNFSIVNNSSYSVTVIFEELNNMKPLTSDACTVISPPRTVLYMCTIARKWSIWQGEYSYKVTYDLA